MQDGLDPIARIRMIRAVYSLSPRQAKEVLLRAEGIATSLDQFQSALATRLEANGLSRSVAEEEIHI